MNSILRNDFNPLGGVVAASILPVSSLDYFVHTSQVAKLSLVTGSSWYQFDLVNQKSQSEQSSSSDQGFNVDSSTLTILVRCTHNPDIALISDMLASGCIIKTCCADGTVKLFGSPSHPVTGSIHHVPGTRHSDLPHLRIEASTPQHSFLLSE